MTFIKLQKNYYETDNISRFTAIIPYLTETERQEWLLRAQRDQKIFFLRSCLLIGLTLK